MALYVKRDLLMKQIRKTIRNWVNIVLAFLYNMCSVNHDSMLQSLIMDQPGSWLNESNDANRNQQVFYYRGMGNGYNNNNAFWLRTGIGVKKFVHPYDTNENRDMGRIRRKAEPAIRYAEILLIYAEALNELDGSHNIESWDGSKTYTIKRDINEMKKGIRPIRCRAGIPDYTAAEYASKDLFREKIKRETYD